MNKLEQIDKNVSEIKSMLEAFINDKNQLQINRRLSMDEISEVVGSFFDISLKMVRSNSRDGHIMAARHMSKYIMATYFHYTSYQISRFIKCHRTSVNATVRRIDGLIAVDVQYKKLYQDVMKEIAKKAINK
jgi:chromosomal replication initiation ATPase DnaA